jgi:Uri superfamily endonuclease
MYESTCTLCNMDNDPEIKDKYQRFKMEKAVYVGESARSIFERAQEHRKDAMDAKEDSHIYKHWRISHPELQEPPTFNIKVVQSF